MASGLWRKARRHRLLLGGVMVLGLALLLLDYWIDEPARRFIEAGANSRLDDYAIQLGSADVKPWNLAIQLEGLTLTQEVHPETPVVTLPRSTLTIEWRALLRGWIVADLVLYRPVVNVDTAQLVAENGDKVALSDKGWQEVLDLYPIKINSVRVLDGTFGYRDLDSGRFLALSGVEARARNIRHVSGSGQPYPSPITMRAQVLDDGDLTLDGHADFLRRPHLAVYGVLGLKRVPLAALGPVVDDYRISLAGGLLDARGQVEIQPSAYIANMDHVDVDHLRIDVRDGPSTPDTRQARRVIATAVDAAGDSPAIRLRMRTLHIRGQLGYSSSTDPAFRLFLADADIRATNLSNRSWQGQSNLALDGAFMGSGATHVRGVWHPETKQPDFAIDIRIQGTDLRSLNDLLRAYGRLDVSAGQLSVYAQLYGRDGHLRGYVKPLFHAVEILGDEDKGDNPFHKLYELVAEQVARLLENRTRDDVATIAELSGDLTDPDVSGWQIFTNLLRNAFVEAILPGFDRERSKTGTGGEQKNR